MKLLLIQAVDEIAAKEITDFCVSEGRSIYFVRDLSHMTAEDLGRVAREAYQRVRHLSRHAPADEYIGAAILEFLKEGK